MDAVAPAEPTLFSPSAFAVTELISIHSTRQHTESIATLQNSAMQLATRPETSSAYMLRLYPLTLERSARLQQIAAEEDYAHEAVRIAYEEERDRVEEEWKKGRERVRERLLEGIEERRRRAREEKDGEGISGECAHSAFVFSPQFLRICRRSIGLAIPSPHHA